MKVFFYSSDDKVPFSLLYDNLGSWKEFLISNEKQYIIDIEKHKAQLMDLVSVEEELTDKVFFVPIEVKDVFLNWITENVNWKQKEVVSKPVMTEIIGENKLNQFLRELNVEEEWFDSLSFPNISTHITTGELKVSLQTTLNDLATEDNGIDAIFVFNRANSTIIHQSLAEGVGGTVNLAHMLPILVELQKTKQVLEEKGHNDFGYFQNSLYTFEKALIHLHFENLKSPVIIGFICKSPDKMGLMQYSIPDAVTKIKGFL
ncbi:MAG: hypothetical protein DRQ99_19435 [Candidatus Parabeggiatoa sp. nov. 3]|jgi:hypothetical protein|nr:MAG: hypothetical protein DRQ99_19435 [Gammaproteobacteria bacterium]